MFPNLEAQVSYTEGNHDAVGWSEDHRHRKVVIWEISVWDRKFQNFRRQSLWKMHVRACGSQNRFTHIPPFPDGTLSQLWKGSQMGKRKRKTRLSNENKLSVLQCMQCRPYRSLSSIPWKSVLTDMKTAGIVTVVRLCSCKIYNVILSLFQNKVHWHLLNICVIRNV